MVNEAVLSMTTLLRAPPFSGVAVSSVVNENTASSTTRRDCDSMYTGL